MIPPLISVILPVYKVENYIGNTIKSFVNQTVYDFELLIVDDGSPDNSIMVAERELSMSSINYRIIHQKNKGVSSARNVGMENSLGKWVICIDSDDIIHPKTIEILKYLIEQFSDIDVFGINFKVIKLFNNNHHFEEIDFINYDLFNKNEIAKSFLLRQIKLIAPGIMIKRQFLIQTGISYNVNVHYSEDQLFIWSLLEGLHRICFIKNTLYYYINRSSSTMTSSNGEKVLTGYLGFKEFTSNSSFDYLNEFILPRWVLGVLNSTSRYMNFKDFKNLAIRLDYKTHVKKLYKFPDKRVFLLAIISNLSLYFFFAISKIKAKVT